MPTPQPDVNPRLTSGNRIYKGLQREAGPVSRQTNFHGFLQLATGNLSTVKLLGTITRPHIITQFQPTSSLGNANDSFVDILLSSDTLVDDAANLRDRHLSGGTLVDNGWGSNINVGTWPINMEILERFTVYKLVMRNNSGLTVSFDVNLSIRWL